MHGDETLLSPKFSDLRVHQDCWIGRENRGSYSNTIEVTAIFNAVSGLRSSTTCVYSGRDGFSVTASL